MNAAETQMLDTLRRMFRRDIAAVRREVEAYPDDESLWTIVPGIANSGGTLALHLAGNLRHFIGAAVGNSGYIRDRDAEFADRGATRAEVAAHLSDAEDVVDRTLSELSASQLENEYSLPVGGLQVRLGPFLLHLAVHLGYHLGQLDYHRRIVTGSSHTVGAVAIPPVFEGDVSRA